MKGSTLKLPLKSFRGVGLSFACLGLNLATDLEVHSKEVSLTEHCLSIRQTSPEGPQADQFLEKGTGYRMEAAARPCPHELAKYR